MIAYDNHQCTNHFLCIEKSKKLITRVVNCVLHIIAMCDDVTSNNVVMTVIDY